MQRAGAGDATAVAVGPAERLRSAAGEAAAAVTEELGWPYWHDIPVAHRLQWQAQVRGECHVCVHCDADAQEKEELLAPLVYLEPLPAAAAAGVAGAAGVAAGVAAADSDAAEQW